MKQVTVRGIPEAVERMIKKEAKEKGMSLNRVLISLLERAAGGKKGRKKVLHHDLDKLCGLWSAEDAEEFEKTLKIQRKVEDTLWKETG